MGEIRAMWGNCGVILNHKETKWKLPQLLYADDADVLAESEKELDRMVSRSDKVYRRRVLKVNASRSMILCL